MKDNKPLHILITAGGTAENIDEVRTITNKATGKLGSIIADEFSRETGARITFICSENSAIPLSRNVEVIKIESVQDLMNNLTIILKNNKYDAVIHSMAVSDYKVRGIMTVNDLSMAIKNEINKNMMSDENEIAEIINSILNKNTINASENKKIDSSIDNLMMFMEKTPKAISIIKKLQPETILFGFKLLVNVNVDKLLRVAYELLIKNNCDFVFANDSKSINADKHEGILMNRDRTYQYLSTKNQIAAAIIAATIKERRNP